MPFATSSAVKEIEQIYNTLGGKDKEMVRLEKSIANLIKEKIIDQEEALSFGINPELLDMFLKH